MFKVNFQISEKDIIADERIVGHVTDLSVFSVHALLCFLNIR